MAILVVAVVLAVVVVVVVVVVVAVAVAVVMMVLVVVATVVAVTKSAVRQVSWSDGQNSPIQMSAHPLKVSWLPQPSLPSVSSMQSCVATSAL